VVSHGALAGVAAPPLDAATVRAALAEVMDPELPMISVVDLGMIGEIAIDGAGGSIAVELFPTFVGCPALEVIRTAVAERLGAFGRPVDVAATFRVPWTTDRITADGLRAPATHGIAAPAAPEDVRCPYCASARVVMDNTFGPTQCRSLHYCRDCRQPFEAMKPV
jgi:ring-1,2-phenylacetyl-CoA epoxidase subunit PaaD